MNEITIEELNKPLKLNMSTMLYPIKKYLNKEMVDNYKLFNHVENYDCLNGVYFIGISLNHENILDIIKQCTVSLVHNYNQENYDYDISLLPSIVCVFYYFRYIIILDRPLEYKRHIISYLEKNNIELTKCKKTNMSLYNNKYLTLVDIVPYKTLIKISNYIKLAPLQMLTIDIIKQNLHKYNSTDIPPYFKKILFI